MSVEGIKDGGTLGANTPGLVQVWYSTNTFQMIERELKSAQPRRLACISCPSVYFRLTDTDRQNFGAKNFEFDRRWSDDPNFVFFDFNLPTNVAPSLHGQFDFLIADPPSIRECLKHFALLSRDSAA